MANVSAQQLLEPSFRFSGKKTIYVTLEDGSEIEGTLHDLDRKKGLIEEVTLKNAKGKKVKLKPAAIKFMYLYPSGYDKMLSAYDVGTDANKWDNVYVKPGLIGEGYVFFEKSQVQVKKKERTLLMQVLNPTFGGEVRVYHDPFAKETTSVGFAGVKVAGGNAKSYYIRKGDNVAVRVKKKDYKKQVFKDLFGSCKKMAKKFPKIDWKDLGEHVSTYGACED